MRNVTRSQRTFTFATLVVIASMTATSVARTAAASAAVTVAAEVSPLVVDRRMDQTVAMAGAMAPVLVPHNKESDMGLRALFCFLAVAWCDVSIAGTEFSQVVANGEPGQLYSSEIEGEGLPLLVEFYYNGCSACNTNAPNVKAMANLYNDEKSHVIEFSYDCRQSEYDSWIRRHAPTAWVLKGCDSSIFDTLNINAFPTTVLLDRNHNVVKRYVGVWSAATKRDIRARLDALRQ